MKKKSVVTPLVCFSLSILGFASADNSSQSSSNQDSSSQSSSSKDNSSQSSSNQDNSNQSSSSKDNSSQSSSNQDNSNQSSSNKDNSNQSSSNKDNSSQSSSNQDNSSQSNSSKDNSSQSSSSQDNSNQSSSNKDNSSQVATSQTSPVQSAARPYDLNIVAPVQVAGSDAASKAFQTSVLPGMLDTIKTTLPEGQYHSPSQIAAMSLDVSKMVLGTTTDARVYFVSEGAGYQNTLGISTTGGSPLSKDAALIFPNVSSSVGYGGSGSGVRSSSEPLAPGDFVNLGTLKAGTALDFFLIANGAVGGNDFFSTKSSLNQDGLNHVVATATKGSPYLLLSFEDLKGGGDRDYNDVVFAIDIGKANVAKIAGLGAPEPSLASGSLLTGLVLLGFMRRRRP